MRRSGSSSGRSRTGATRAEGDADRRAALVAVDHPDVAERYRHGRAIVEGSHDADDSTEKLRVAMMDFRTVLEDVVGERQAA